MAAGTRDERRAFVGHWRYGFPDCCVVCLAPTAERRELWDTAEYRLVQMVTNLPTLQEYKYQDVLHKIPVAGVPYCREHVPEGNQPKLDSHGLRVRARRHGGILSLGAESIQVANLIFEFENPEYAARFREHNNLHTPSERRREFADAMAKALPRAAGALFKSDTWTKARLSYWADQGGGRALGRSLTKGLSHKSAAVRRHALRMVNRRFHDDSVEAAAQEARGDIVRLAEDTDDFTRSLAIEMLSRFGPDDDLLPVVLQAVDDESEHVRFRAATALDQYPDASAVEALILLLDDDAEIVRQYAVGLLGRRGDVARDKLARALDDESEKVREAARIALGR